jgi:hypothetical protein
MHYDWFNGIEILQGRRQHGEKVGYCYPSGLEKTLCKWEMYVPLVTKGLRGKSFARTGIRTSNRLFHVTVSILTTLFQLRMKDVRYHYL